MKPEQFEDAPKLLGKSEVQREREAQLGMPHIERLTAFVNTLREKKGSGFEIPYFDPWDGGVDAEVLFLLEAPGSRAKASGFVSRNNPDETAKNFFDFNYQVIPRKRTILWNAVPWYIGNASKIRPATSQDVNEGIESLRLLFLLLPKLKAIVLVGKKAQRAEDRIAKLNPNLKIFKSPHPSPLCVNRLACNKENIVKAIREVADYIG